MNPFLAWLSRFSSLALLPAVWGIFLAGAGLYLIYTWRIRFLILLVQYFCIGILFVRIFDTRPEMAVLKILVGWLICGAFLISAHVRGRVTGQQRLYRYWAANLPFRILSLIVMTMVAYLATQKYPLPFISADLALGCFILILLALLYLGTEEDDVMLMGVGVLNFLAALEIFYLSQDPGLAVTGLLMIVNLIIGLATSYLSVVEVPK